MNNFRAATMAIPGTHTGALGAGDYEAHCRAVRMQQQGNSAGPGRDHGPQSNGSRCGCWLKSLLTRVRQDDSTFAEMSPQRLNDPC